MGVRRLVSYLLASLCGAAVLAADQLTKHYVSSNFVLGESREFISGFIDLTYIHNRGGAWGMLYGYTYILLPVTVIIMLLCVFLYIRYAKKQPPCAVGDDAGAVGRHRQYDRPYFPGRQRR